MKIHVPPPQTETELMQRATNIAGAFLGELAQDLNITVPKDLLNEKGWVGQLLELALGATAGNKAKPDFEFISVELKTIPLNEQGRPKESTFVCKVPQRFALTWHESHVWQKLKRVLWVPIEASKMLPLTQRRIAHPVLWSPNTKQERILCQDWEELSEMLSLGQYEQLSAKHGRFLQCRPKAAHSRILKKDIDQQGRPQFIVPRGFYLRTCFTHDIIQQN